MMPIVLAYFAKLTIFILHQFARLLEKHFTALAKDHAK
jgi:hypothetical protein